MSILEDSHSLATAAEDGTVHIWRVDMASAAGQQGQQQEALPPGDDNSS